MKKLVIDSGIVKENISAIKRKADSAIIIADLSCDAQGLGLLKTAALLRAEGISNFAVYEVEDAEKLRRNGFVDEHILMLRSTVGVEEIGRLVENNVACTIGSYDAGIAANSVAVSRSTVIEVQIKVNSGIGQYGFLPSELDKITKIFRQMPGLAVSGMYTRFSGPGAGKAAAARQLETFEKVLLKLHESGIETGMAHALDSYALFKCDLDKLDAVCIGSAIAGRTVGVSQGEINRAGYIEADIDELDWLPAGSVVGAGKGVRLKKSTKVAVVSVGWFNGVGLGEANAPRSFKSIIKGAPKPVIRLDGKKLKLVGDIGATCILLDVTDISCCVGDKVTIDCDPRMIKGIPVEYR